MLTHKYQDEGYAKATTHDFLKSDGSIGTRVQIEWTERDAGGRTSCTVRTEFEDKIRPQVICLAGGFCIHAILRLSIKNLIGFVYFLIVGSPPGMGNNPSLMM